jgi:uncharacterized protein YjbJ (UPF0337 family)
MTTHLRIYARNFALANASRTGASHEPAAPGVLEMSTARKLLSSTRTLEHQELIARIEGQGTTMNWKQIEGQWHQLVGQAKSKWGKLTDDDLKNVAGKKDQLIGMVEERYGVMKEDAEKQVDEWLAKLSVPSAKPNNSVKSN